MYILMTIALFIGFGGLMVMQQGNEREKRLHDLRRARYVREQKKKGLTK